MPTKDRLVELQQAAAETDLVEIKTKGTKNKDLRKTFQATETTKDWIKQVETNTEVCEGILNSSLHSISPEYQEKLQSIFKKSENICVNISNSLKKISNELEAAKDQHSTEYRMKYLQYTSAKVCFKEALENHQQCVQKHRDLRKEIIRKCNGIVNGDDLDENSLEVIVEGSDGRLFVQNYLAEERLVRQQLSDLEERHKELLAIESHLVEVKDMFVKLALLVEQQQSNIDRVEHHALIANDYIDNTKVNLNKANKSKKKNRKITLIVSVIVIFAILLTLVIIFN